MDFTLNRTWPVFYNYIPVYKISILYTNPFKRYRMETKSVTFCLILYTCVHNFSPIHQPLQKISHGNHFSKLKIFQSQKKAITPKIIGGFYPKSNLTCILWLYTGVNPIHQSFQKISLGNQKCYVRDGRDGPTYVRTAVILYAPPVENGGSIKNESTLRLI